MTTPLMLGNKNSLLWTENGIPQLEVGHCFVVVVLFNLRKKHVEELFCQ